MINSGEKSPLLITVYELVKPKNMRYAQDEQLPDRPTTPPEYETKEPTGPEGDLKEWVTFGIDENGKKVPLKELAFLGEWENGYSGWVRVPINHEHLKDILENEI